MTDLKQAREERGIKQVAVAEMLGVSRQTYALYEANPGRMSIDQAKAVCKFLGCSVNEIFFRKDVN